MTPGSSRTLDADGLVIGAADTIYTYTGRTIRPLDPDPNDICIEDIAHALSNQCRFTGHTKRFYSVAEHCVLASYIVPPEYALEALLHDASEAYLSDIARPVKKAPGFAETYLKYEAALETAIQKAFRLPIGPMSERVKEADERMLGVEIHKLLPPAFVEAYGPIEQIDLHEIPHCWVPMTAEWWFLDAFDRYWYEREKAKGELL